MSEQKIEQIRMALQDIEQALKELDLWNEDESSRPDDQAFLSTVPFCLDTMEFPCWLQYVLIPKFQDLLKTPNSLPKKICVHTVAEEYFRGRWCKVRALLVVLRRFDALFIDNLNPCGKKY